MEVPDLISEEVWEKARKAFENREHWVAYNNTLLFVHEMDIQFFTNKDDAEDFVFDNLNEAENWKVEQIPNLNAFKEKVERIMPGLVYKPVSEVSILKEPEHSYFPNDQLFNNKTIIMNAENLDYLKNQLKFLGFGEGLYSQLENKMKEGKPEFTLDASSEFGKDKMQAVLHFSYSDKEGKDNYFFNNYVATLLKEEQNLSQFIYVNNKGQSITFKESCNLLNGRSVFKEITPREGAPYKAWLKIDHEKIDPKTNYPKLRPFGSNYGFDLKEAVGRMPFKELGYADQAQTLMKSLQKGNAAGATLLKNGKEEKVSLEANPQFKTLNMYDKDGVKLFYPMEKVEQKYGQAPVDAKKSEEQSVAAEPPLTYGKADLLEKNKPSNGLLERKPSQKPAGQKIK